MRTKVSIGILILGLVVYLFLVWPRQVNLELDGIAYSQSDSTNFETVSIKIDGQINNPYFGPREFNGNLYCEALGVDEGFTNLSFDGANKSYLSILQEGSAFVDCGEIFADKTMNELVIVQEDTVFVFPSENLEAAKKTADQYFQGEYNYHFQE